MTSPFLSTIENGKGLHFHIFMTAFFYFWLSQSQEPTKRLSFPNPAHTTLEKCNLLKLPKVVFKNYNTAFEFKQKDFRNYQMFLHCEQHKNLKAFIHAACAAVDILLYKLAFPVFAASVLQLLLQPLVSVGQFTCRNA